MSSVRSESSQISYRAFWISASGAEFATDGGLWRSVPVRINNVTTGNWRFLETNP